MHKPVAVTEANRESIMHQIADGNIELISYEAVCSDRLVRVHNQDTPEQRMETLERSDFCVPVIEDSVEIIEVEERVA